MPDYSKGKIYALRSHQTPDIYIGSTIQSLAKRKYEHMKKYTIWKKDNTKSYYTSYKICEYDDVYVELIE